MTIHYATTFLDPDDYGYILASDSRWTDTLTGEWLFSVKAFFGDGLIGLVRGNSAQADAVTLGFMDLEFKAKRIMDRFSRLPTQLWINTYLANLAEAFSGISDGYDYSSQPAVSTMCRNKKHYSYLIASRSDQLALYALTNSHLSNRENVAERLHSCEAERSSCRQWYIEPDAASDRIHEYIELEPTDPISLEQAVGRAAGMVSLMDNPFTCKDGYDPGLPNVYVVSRKRFGSVPDHYLIERHPRLLTRILSMTGHSSLRFH